MNPPPEALCPAAPLGAGTPADAGPSAALPVTQASPPDLRPGWPESLCDRWFHAWALRAQARWVQEPAPIPHRYY